MPADIEFKVEGLDELIQKSAKLDGNLGPIVRDFFDKSTKHIEHDAKRFAPVGISGHLRASITTKIDAQPIPLWALTGTNVKYARPMEYGATYPRKPPPILALVDWSFKHGLNPWAVRASIKKHGLRPRDYIGKAWEEAQGPIDDFLKQAKDRIEGYWI